MSRNSTATQQSIDIFPNVKQQELYWQHFYDRSIFLRWDFQRWSTLNPMGGSELLHTYFLLNFLLDNFFRVTFPDLVLLGIFIMNLPYRDLITSICMAWMIPKEFLVVSRRYSILNSNRVEIFASNNKIWLLFVIPYCEYLCFSNLSPDFFISIEFSSIQWY